MDALKDTNNRLRYEQMVSGVRPNVEALRECINEKSYMREKIDVLYNFNHGSAAVLVVFETGWPGG